MTVSVMNAMGWRMGSKSLGRLLIKIGPRTFIYEMEVSL